MAIEGLRLADLETLLDVDHFGSMNEVARLRRVQPSTVSKAIRRLEREAGRQLVVRSVRGASLTPAGRELVASAGAFVRILESWGETRGGEERARATVLNIGAPSAVAGRLLPRVRPALHSAFPDLFFRLVDLRPSESLAAGLSGHFQAIFHWEPLDWPQTWWTEAIGAFPWRLYARADHPVGRSAADPEAVLRYRFVLPVYWDRHEFVPGGDRCPAPAGERLRGDATETAEAALRLIEGSDQLAFLPTFVADESRAGERIAEVKVRGWRPVARDLFLSVKGDEIQMRLLRALQGALQSELSRLADEPR